MALRSSAIQAAGTLPVAELRATNACGFGAAMQSNAEAQTLNAPAPVPSVTRPPKAELKFTILASFGVRRAVRRIEL